MCKKIELQEWLKLAEQENFDISKYVIKRKSKLREYRIWKAMRTRTHNTNIQKNVKYYISKNIIRCERWDKGFEYFLFDMGLAPDDTYSIDRIDGDKGYCKDNCRWATCLTQSKNRKDFVHNITFNGKTMNLKDWAKEQGLNYSTVHQRYRRGYSLEEILNKDLKDKLYYTFNGIRKTLTEWCKDYNIEHKVVYNRIYKHNWEALEALQIPKDMRRKDYYNNKTEDIV